MQPTPDPAASAVLALVFLPFVAAALVPLVYRALGERTAYYAAAVALACFGLVASQYGTHGSVSVPWIPSLGVSLRFYVDGLSLLIGFLASGVGVLILTYSGGYMHGEPGQPKYYAALLAFMGSMLGVAFAADLVALFVFWELTSLSSFVLIGHYQREESSQYASRKSMLITVSGGLFMLVGFLLLHGSLLDVTSGSNAFDIVWMLHHADLVQEHLRAAGLFLPVLGLLVIGAAAKSAQVPLHIWLPNAMEAPTPVSAFLHSATMVKAGVYLLGRFRPIFLSHEWELLVAALGLITMTVAAILAVGATDIKELLAYSTASHLGLIVAGFGFLSEFGGETGVFHIINHATFKATLFLVAGIIAHEAGTRKIENLGGLAEDLPITAAITTVAALGMAGVPPFNGFYSKELLFESAWEAAAHAGGLAWLYPVVAVFGSVFTFLYSIRFLMLFFGEKPTGLHKVHSPSWVLVGPPLVLATVAGVIGLGGVLATFGVHLPAFDHFVGEVLASTLPPGEAAHAFSYHLPTSLKPSAAMSAITIAIGAAAYPFYDRLHRGVDRLTDVDVLRANWYYNTAVYGLNGVSDATAATVQNGLLRTYATWVLTAITALALGGYAAASVALPGFALAPGLTLPIALVLGVAIVGAVAVSVAPSHVSGVLTLSILGFMVAVFYVLADAPDLALTQLVVETLSLVIFLLVLDKLPAFYGGTDRGRMVRDGALALAVGATVFVTVLVSTAATPAHGIAESFTNPAITVGQAGGHNIVNVILVDFRGFDTMGEISVISMAALSVLTLVAMRERGETQ